MFLIGEKSVIIRVGAAFALLVDVAPLLLVAKYNVPGIIVDDVSRDTLFLVPFMVAKNLAITSVLKVENG